MIPRAGAESRSLARFETFSSARGSSGGPTWNALVMDIPAPTRRLLLGTVASLGVLPTSTSLAVAVETSTAAPPPAEVPPRSPPLGATELLINGRRMELQLDPDTTLLDALREQTALTGTKKGCDMGSCGACTVHVDGRRVLACLTLAMRCEGKPITTIEGLTDGEGLVDDEGLADGDALHVVQAAFVEHDALQCGYCTPGQIMSAVALINEGHARTDDEIREWMSGNICRCGAYPNIVAAVRQAAGLFEQAAPLPTGPLKTGPLKIGPLKTGPLKTGHHETGHGAKD
jgi:xanthine dehydrogenase YagT iron-sulfur-binding subunit